MTCIAKWEGLVTLGNSKTSIFLAYGGSLALATPFWRFNKEDDF